MKICNAEQERLDLANRFVNVIASCGRKFFHHNGFVSYFELSEHGRVFFIDYYTKKRIYTHKRCGRWKGFTSGGTLKALVESLRDFIKTGRQLNIDYFNNEMSNRFRNPWGYGDDLEIVKGAAESLGIAKLVNA